MALVHELSELHIVSTIEGYLSIQCPLDFTNHVTCTAIFILTQSATPICQEDMAGPLGGHGKRIVLQVAKQLSLKFYCHIADAKFHRLS